MTTAADAPAGCDPAGAVIARTAIADAAIAGHETAPAAAAHTAFRPIAFSGNPPAAPGAGLDAGAALMLQAWLSPAFPVGAYAYSHGLEWTVETGVVADLASLSGWIEGVLRHGAGRTDAILFCHAARAAAALAGDETTGEVTEAALVEAAELAAALAPTRERRLETVAQGEAFLRAVTAIWPAPALARAAAVLEGRGIAVAYPIAVGIAAGVHGLPPGPVAAAFLNAFAANLASAAVRLVPLGQTDGQRAVALAMPVALAVAAEAETAGLDDIGGAALAADVASARHETQYTRLFRS